MTQAHIDVAKAFADQRTQNKITFRNVSQSLDSESLRNLKTVLPRCGKEECTKKGFLTRGRVAPQFPRLCNKNIISQPIPSADRHRHRLAGDAGGDGPAAAGRSRRLHSYSISTPCFSNYNFDRGAHFPIALIAIAIDLHHSS